MKNRTFNWEIQTLLEQFAQAFNDVVISRYDDGKELLDPPEKKVVFVYGPKTRLFQYLNNPAPGGLTLPAISISISGISRDSKRVFNKHEGFSVPYAIDKEIPTVRRIPQPVPINIGVNMSIASKYQNDMDQVLSNFAPYCDPYIVISWALPDKDLTAELRTEVLWSGDIRLSYPVDLAGSTNFRILADTSFTIKGWMFKKMDEEYRKIYKIDHTYSSTDFRCDIFTQIEDDYTESFSLSGVPQF